MARMMTIPEKLLEDVQRFSDEVLGLKVPDTPTLLTYSRQQFAVEFLREEVNEFQQAWDNGSIDDAADAMVDLVYVALGRLIEMGVPPGPVFDTVHRANMAKHRGKTKRGTDTDAAKPEGWKAPDHSWLLTFTEADVKVLKQVHHTNATLKWVDPLWVDPLWVDSPQKKVEVTTDGHGTSNLTPEEESLLNPPKQMAQKKDPLAKPQTALIPYESTVAQAQAMAYGAYIKYKPWDWTGGRPFSQMRSSIDHHLAAWFDRERDDPESEVHHLGHALANIGMLLGFEAMGRTDLDDRRPAHTVTMHTPTEEATGEEFDPPLTQEQKAELAHKGFTARWLTPKEAT